MNLLVGLTLLVQAAPQDTVVLKLPEVPRVMLTYEVRERLLEGYRAWTETPTLSGVCLYGAVVPTPIGTALQATHALEVNELNCPFYLNYDKRLIGFLQFINPIAMQVTKTQLMDMACKQLDVVPLYYRVVGYVVGIKLYPGPNGPQPYEESVGCVRTKLNEDL